MTGTMRKLLVASLVVLLIVSLMAGCGNKPKQSSAMKTVLAAKKLIVGTEAGFKPFEYVDENSKIVGFDIDLANEVAKDLGVTVELSEMKFDSLIPALQTSKINMIAAAMGIKPDRQAVVDFSNPYFDSAQSIVVTTANTTITKAADLDGKKIAVQTGTTGDTTVTETYKNAKVTRLDRFADAFLMLQDGRVDAVVLDTPVAQSYLATAGGKMKIVGDPMASEQYALVFTKGSQDLVDAANKTLARMTPAATLDKLLQKWFK